jgi:hypothetical protein
MRWKPVNRIKYLMISFVLSGQLLLALGGSEACFGAMH